MTEISVNTKSTERYMIDPVAFFAALLLGPILFTAATFWALYIPLFALAFGGPVYLAIGTPVLLWHLSRNAPDAAEIAGLAMATVGIAAVILVAFYLIADMRSSAHFVIMAAVPSLIFAPLWGACFGALYISLRRDFFTQTV